MHWTEVGDGLPSTPAKNDSNPVAFNNNKTGNWISMQVTPGALPLTEEGVKGMYAVNPLITKTTISGLPAYKATWSKDEKIPYDAYFVEKSNTQLYYIKVSNDNDNSIELLNSLVIY